MKMELQSILEVLEEREDKTENKIDDLDSCIITNDDIDSIFSENS